jgi:hypothetical protein
LLLVFQFRVGDELTFTALLEGDDRVGVVGAKSMVLNDHTLE